ncbi:hypothetical protein DSCW_23520 [Desulfosarcina widdelii]|uniref:Glycosyltransferase RgtA/B/C/D-like domain-containing protein n=1 Tax=Desulfosarcina widdelii TaxID=947919 RepID=A0A5K7Z2K5_9BACT|nr:hypothetical protein [Desulfosarcina widdelii]BBO74935.1 hypothetical protein DSCW_23520 [Desulfosarcina widdelii]
MTACIALGLIAETMLFVMAGFAWLRSKGYTLAEAYAGAVVTVFVLLSLIHQCSLLVGSPWPGAIMEGAFLTAVLVCGRRWLPWVHTGMDAVRGMIRREILPGWIILTAGLLMLGVVVLGDPKMAFLPSNPMPPEFLTGGYSGGQEALAEAGSIPVLNAPALFFHTARFGLAARACGFGLLAYLAIGCCTYALARRYAWPPMALTVALLVLSMPRLVWLGLWPTAELIGATAVAFSLVLIYRLLEQHQPGDLRLFFVSILFSIDSNAMSIALSAVMVLLLLVVMIRRHGWLMFREMVMDKPLAGAMVLLPLLGLAQVPVGLMNLAHGHPLLGSGVAVDNGGIMEAGANLVRYLFASVDATEPIQKMLNWMLGVDLNGLLGAVYNALVLPVFTGAGIRVPFAPLFSGSGQMAFGPFASLLVLPAIAHALLRGPRRLKALSLAWVGYLYVASLVANWHPANLAVLTPLFAAGGFVVAFSLPPWRLRRRGMRLLQIDFALLLAWAIVRVAGGT